MTTLARTVNRTLYTTASSVGTEPPTTSQRQCGAELTSTSGVFQTQNWPETYPVSVDCEWNIEIPGDGKVIQISFDSSVFGIAGRLPDCEKDWLKIYDGDNVDAPMWGPFCHFALPNTMQTSSTTAKVMFHAGPVHNPSRRGFKAYYRSVDRPPENPTGKVN